MSKEESKKSSGKRKHDDNKERKRAKREKKKQLLQQLPQTNEDGIAFTKLQVRRMLKRVKRGLPPIPTPEEQEELKHEQALMNKQEDALLAGHTDAVREEEGDSGEEVSNGDGGGDSHDGEKDEQGDAATSSTTNQQASNTNVVSTHTTTPSRKRKTRSKPVPDDYVCQACQNQHTPSHWIYDCPSKVTKRGSNHVSKKLRGIQAPDDRKVFVSGLSFDMKKRDVETLFKDCGTIVHCKLLTFEDTGRCKGQAYVTFDSEASARKAKVLSGTTISTTSSSDGKSKTKKKKESPTKRKELKLKVTKVLNRTQTKHKTNNMA